MTLGRHAGFDMAEYVRPDKASIHPKAEVTDSEVGDGTKVWQFASVVRNSRVGKNCVIASCAIVDGAEVGDNVHISHGAFIDPGIVIGDRVFIGPHVSMCNDFWPRVNKQGFAMEKLVSREFVTTKVEDGASIGANCVVLPGVVIGRDAMVAAGSTVVKNVPAGHLHKRDGSVVPIELSRAPARMRIASA